MKFIPVAEPVIGETELNYVIDAVKSGWVSSIGPYIEKFENKFAEYLDVKHAIAVGNGTEGLHLGLHALGIGFGDEVIMPDLTFVATAHSVIQTGAEPVFVDIDPISLCIDPNLIEEAISSKTKAIMPVHLYGQPANMKSIKTIAEKYNLFVIEDCAEAHGSEYYEKKVGAFGDIGVFSFYGNKVVTTGEGGMVVTNNSKLAERLRFLKDHGMHPNNRYYHNELAFNYRITNIQAALGLAQIEQIDKFIEKKQQIYDWYKMDFSGIEMLNLLYELPYTKSTKWFTCITLNNRFHISRNEFGNLLHSKGIDWRPFFIPMHLLPHLKNYKKFGKADNDCPVSTEFSLIGMNLPSGCNLTREDISYITSTISDLIKEYDH